MAFLTGDLKRKRPKSYFSIRMDGLHKDEASKPHLSAVPTHSNTDRCLLTLRLKLICAEDDRDIGSSPPEGIPTSGKESSLPQMML